jgi:hypothetical protein
MDAFALYAKMTIAVIFGIWALASFNLSGIGLFIVAIFVLYFTCVFLAGLEANKPPARVPFRGPRR